MQTESDLSFDHVLLPPTRQIGLHQHATWELSYIICGSGTRTIGDCQEPFSEGEVVLVAPNTPHCWQFAEASANSKGHIENITINFPQKFIQQFIDSFPQLRSLEQRIHFTADSVRFGETTASRLASIMTSMEEESEAMRLTSLLRLIVIMAESNEKLVFSTEPKETDAERRMRQVVTYMRCNYKHTVTIDELARHTGMNRCALCTFFKRRTGNTLMTYLTGLRISQAQYLLHNSDLSIAEVSYRSGFKDVPYFNRVFRRETGLSPSQWRNTQAQKFDINQV